MSYVLICNNMEENECKSLSKSSKSKNRRTELAEQEELSVCVCVVCGMCNELF